MASIVWFFSAPVLPYRKSLATNRRFDICKPIYSSNPSSPVLPFRKSLARNRRFDICKPIHSSNPSSPDSIAVEPTIRRTANFESSLWSYDHIQSLSTKYIGGDYEARRHTLKGVVKTMIQHCQTSIVDNPLSSLELVDKLQRLGISHHFEDEIRDVLEIVYNNYYNSHDKWSKMDLNLKALGFRLLRQHDYPVPQEIFSNFEDNIQNVNPCSHEDMVRILNLYEASYHSFEDENILDDVKDFTTKYLTENLEKIDESISSFVSHALELPLHWRVPRVEARWFIDAYEISSGMNPTLIELAKLDFNMVQAIHHEDLKYASRWWENTCWATKLPFTRDRLVENFLWSVGFSYLPRFSLGRRNLTKVNAILTTIDDVYDVYGTVDELEQFTDVICRWDINAVQELPDYMKISFLAFYNAVNEMAYNTLTNTGFFCLPYLKKAWAEWSKAGLVEAKWYHSGYTPTLQEYLNNACETIACELILAHIMFSISAVSNEEILQCFESSENVIRYSAIIFRLVDDLATSSDEIARGDTPKAVQCYMHESGASEAEARTYIKMMMDETWKKLNKERAHANSQFFREYINYAADVVRTAQLMYGKGDGHGSPYILKDVISSLFFNPVQGI
ncbi:terpene synthase 7 [Artemisia annua]|uniref:Terpene synthase 7 n=1 Tax=Artemisia annua TaxID=35608 RepID=A0A165D1P5_ARTAN|nr:terpene synthase 7 [Artemisia annua]PWA73563.1 terpene synthase 7 [Artemisia annua]